MSDRRPANTIQELDVHFGYLQLAIGQVQGTISEMATKKDIEALSARLETFASKDDLERLKAIVHESTAGSRIKALAAWATSLLAIFGLCVALWAGAIELVHWRDMTRVAKP